mmetsp:Transcript_53838/g.125539  ORF Transcript_53838/g.125539 Transcript_53838/m.125539 type:complete len:521 (-) Transcript_53838:120-1682(-)
MPEVTGMLSVTPAPDAGLPGQPEAGVAASVSPSPVLGSRLSASFSSGSDSSSDDEGDDKEDPQAHLRQANARRRVSLAEQANFAMQVQGAEEAQEEVQKQEQDPGCLRKACKLATRKRLGKIVRSRWFLITVALIITANAIYMGIEVDANTAQDRTTWTAIEISFSVVFACELALRLVATIPVKQFFTRGWNLFDLLIVAASIVDNVLTVALRNSSDLNRFSVLRLLRLIRVIRVFRLLRVLDGLWKLVKGILNAAWTLFWTWILLATVIYIFSIVSTRLIGQPYRGETFYDEYFGSVDRSMLTLFQATTTEGWAQIARQVMERQPWSSAFFILYLHVTTFAILNVMIAVIVESTLDEADQSKLKSAEKRLEDLRKAYEKIHKVFQDGDNNQDGVLTRDEFREQMQQPKVARYFEEIGIDPNEAEYLFTILDYDGSGYLDAAEFVGGLLKVIGSAKAKDIMAVHCELRRSEREGRQQIGVLEKSLDKQMQLIESGVQVLQQEVHALRTAVGVPGTACTMT